MLRKPQIDADDPPKDPTIQRWFHALGEPPVAHDLPGARVRLLARIEQQQRRMSFAWLSSLATPAVATGLAACLLLSLALNVWWGNRILRSPAQGASQVATTRAETVDTTSPLSIYRFQARMQNATALGPLVAARTPHAAPTPVVGFTPHAVPATAFVRLGILYADVLAALHSGTVQAATPHLAGLAQTLTTVQAPRALSQYIHGMQDLLTQPTYDSKTLTQFAALFGPLYEDAYARQTVASEVILFRVGAWLENLSLAAAAGDKAALQQEPMIRSLHRALRQLNVSPNTLDALEQLGALVAHQALTEQDVSTIGALVQKIQQRLSE